MATKRLPRRQLDRYGVKLLTLASGAHVARWRDPLSGRQGQANLDLLGLGNADSRVRWASDKARSLADLRAKVTSGNAVSKRVGLAKAVDDYLAGFENAKTKAGKKIVLLAVREWLEKNGARDSASLQPALLMRWRDYHLRPDPKGLEPSTRNRWLGCVSAWLRWCSERGMVPLLSLDAIRSATKRAKQPSKAIEFLRPSQLKALLQAVARHDADAPGRWRPMGPFVMTLLLSGGRYSEIAGLRWDEVSLADDYIELGAGRVKTRRSRRIGLAETPKLRALLQALALRRGDAELVFGEFTYGTTQAALARLVQEYKAPPFTPHVLRRTAGTVLTCSSVYGAAGAFLSAKRLGHGVQLAERHYAAALTGLPADARTFEAAAGIEDECDAIIRQNGGAVAVVEREGVASLAAN